MPDDPNPPNASPPNWEDDTGTERVRVDPVATPHETFPCLVVVAGPQIGQVFPITTRRKTLGRADDADLCIREQSISRHHAAVFKDAEGFCRVEDLASRNGTFVNGSLIGRVVLTASDRIQLGKDVILKFEYHSEVEGKFHAHLYEAGTTDPLTGTHNRRYFDTHLTGDFRLCVRHREPLSLMMIDVDNFKRINDTHGHLAGDAVLHQIAKLLGSRVRTEDVLSRYGGEEFAIILRRTRLKGAHSLAEAIRGMIEKTAFSFQRLKLDITVSIGVSCLEPHDAYDSAMALLEAADKALYAAKEAGRNRVVSAE